MATKKSAGGFDLSKYQIGTTPYETEVVIEDTGDSFPVTVRPMSWSKRNQLISKCLNWSNDGNTSFNGDVYVRECLKEMIVEAPWGRTTEAFLTTIDGRLGTALEALVPEAFGQDGLKVDDVKKG
jgi:hypothetical protein|tara:strand:- start:2484 stop:2858 length:375 start_codon:yes stop_codon:yes gene_type:complete